MTPLERPDTIHHVALQVQDIGEAVAWYEERFDCSVDYQDETWALLGFANLSLALVIPEQHPPHVAFEATDASHFGPLKGHRDGTRSTYIQDPWGNAVEILELPS